jgi:hypothetical protein
MEKKEKNYFQVLSEINVNDKVEKKNGLSYLSWAWAIMELKKYHPYAISKVYETPEGVNYWNDGKTAWVKTSVTIDGHEEIDYLPVMDYKNKSIPLNAITSFDVNKSIKRSLTKAMGYHGLGLYIYAGEDLPEGEELDNLSPYNGKKQEGVTSASIKSKFAEIKNELETSADLPTLKAVWQDYKKDLEMIKSFDIECYNNLETIKDKAKELLSA